MSSIVPTVSALFTHGLCALSNLSRSGAQGEKSLIPTYAGTTPESFVSLVQAPSNALPSSSGNSIDVLENVQKITDMATHVSYALSLYKARFEFKKISFSAF